MSVASNWKDLPPRMIPKRLNSFHKDARGDNRLYCWQMGEGPFDRAPVSDGLQLAPDRGTHGVVEPDSSMPIESFQLALAATRDAWKFIPEESPS